MPFVGTTHCRSDVTGIDGTLPSWPCSGSMSMATLVGAMVSPRACGGVTARKLASLARSELWTALVLVVIRLRRRSNGVPPWMPCHRQPTRPYC